MPTLDDLRQLLEESSGCVVLVLITRDTNGNAIGDIRSRAQNAIDKFNPDGWKCVLFAQVPAQPPAGGDPALSQLRTLLRADDPSVDGVVLKAGDGLNREAKYYRIDELDTSLELIEALAGGGV